MFRSLIALLLVIAPTSVFAQAKLKLPAAAERESASALIRDLFKAELAQTTTIARIRLANKFLEDAAKTKDDPASRFELYRMAAELAAGVQITISIKALEELLNVFEGPVSAVVEPTFKVVATKSTSPEANQELAQFGIRLVEESLSAEDFDTAFRLQKITDSAGKLSKNLKLAKQAQGMVKEIEAFKAAKAKSDAAIVTLKAKPDDPAAALEFGRYCCFAKGDWATGLSFLAKSSDATLKSLAMKDLTASADNPASFVAVADGWYAQLGMLVGLPKSHLQARIYALYAKALPATEGLTKTKIEKRLEELAGSVQLRNDDLTLWTVVRPAIAEKTYERIEPMGGAFGRGDYSEILPEGGILIGFHYTLKAFFDKDLIDHFQPIYMTAAGEKVGAAYGTFRDAKKLTLKAKPGYAIGKMAIRGGGLWGGTNVVFMKIDGKGLNATDSYESGWIGHKDDPRSPFLGDGRPIIGIHGKLQEQREGGGICSIGLFVVGAKPQ